MSIVAKVAKFTIRAILSSLAKEAAKCERKVQYTVAKRDSKVATLDKTIIALSKTEDAKIAKIREQAEMEVRNIIKARTKLMNKKNDLRWNCGAECRNLNKKGQDALALKAKLEAVLK